MFRPELARTPHPRTKDSIKHSIKHPIKHLDIWIRIQHEIQYKTFTDLEIKSTQYLSIESKTPPTRLHLEGRHRASFG
jgi:hypothetical protein